MSVLGFISGTCQVVMPRLWPLTALDRHIARSVGDRSVLPPIFIVGPPRTGTTILYQRLLTSFEFTYPSNVDSALFTLPCMAHTVTRHVKDRIGQHGESSEYGYISGLWGASEAGPMMRYFLESEARRPAFGDAVRYMTDVSSAPFLCKNTLNATRLPGIFDALPEAWIVRTYRDREATARSILKLRRRLGDEQTWAGVKPEGAARVAQLAPIDQARWQYDAIQAQIDRDLERCNRTAFSVVHEDFVQRPSEVFDEIMKAYELSTGRSLRRRSES